MIALRLDESTRFVILRNAVRLERMVGAKRVCIDLGPESVWRILGFMLTFVGGFVQVHPERVFLDEE